MTTRGQQPPVNRAARMHAPAQTPRRLSGQTVRALPGRSLQTVAEGHPDRPRGDLGDNSLGSALADSDRAAYMRLNSGGSASTPEPPPAEYCGPLGPLFRFWTQAT